MATFQHNQMVEQRGILFAPDYVVNVGGVLGGTKEIGLLTDSQYKEKLEGIYDTTIEIFQRATKENVTPEEAAQNQAEDKLNR